MNQLLKLFFISLLFSSGAFGKVFQTDYLSFQLPADWNCQSISPNWLCEPMRASQKRFAIITITAKEASATDQLSSFAAHLAKPRTHQTGSNTPVMSQVLKTGKMKVAGQEWVQSVHMSSEVKDFMTMYLATVKKPLAIMVTFSAERTRWDQFKPAFDQILKTMSLKPYQRPLANKGDTSPAALTGPQKSPLASQMTQPLTSAPSPLAGMPKPYLYGLGLAGLALLAALYLFLKR
jgi:hypothetical protein